MSGLAALALWLAACLGGCPPTNGNDPIKVTVSDEGGGEALSGRSPDQVVALARSEGEVCWFTSIPEGQAQKFAQMFEKKQPGVRVRLVRGGTFDLVGRIERDIRAGTPAADVLHVLDPAIFVTLRQRGELLYYPSAAEAAIAPEYRDPGYWSAARLVAIGLAYDKRRVKAAQVPRQWSELLGARWKGKLGVKDAQTAGSAYAQYYFLREKYGVDFWEQMAAQQPKVYRTEDALLEALVAGEIQVAAGVADYRIREFAKAQPGIVGAVWPTDGSPLIIGPVAILSRAPHPNAARLFMDFCLSREGQAGLRDLVGAYPSRGDVGPPPEAPSLEQLHPLTAPSGWSEYLAKQGDLRAEYTRLFHGETE